jgi:hypothetical protein
MTEIRPVADPDIEKLRTEQQNNLEIINKSIKKNAGKQIKKLKELEAICTAIFVLCRKDVQVLMEKWSKKNSQGVVIEKNGLVF